MHSNDPHPTKSQLSQNKSKRTCICAPDETHNGYCGGRYNLHDYDALQKLRAGLMRRTALVKCDGSLFMQFLLFTFSKVSKFPDVVDKPCA